MKKIFSMIGALLAGAAMLSCTAPEETQPALGTTITVTPETVEVAGQDAEEITLQVACDGVWLAQTESWITVEPMTGEGNATVTVKVANNMDPEAPEELDAPRKGVITFAVGKENVVKVNVLIGINFNSCLVKPVFTFPIWFSNESNCSYDI